MKGRQHLLVKYSSKREVLRVLSYHREQESAETFGKGEALAVTLNYGLIKTNRPKIPKHTHKLSRMSTKNGWCISECSVYKGPGPGAGVNVQSAMFPPLESQKIGQGARKCPNQEK